MREMELVWVQGEVCGVSVGDNSEKAKRLARLFGKAEELYRLLRESRYHLENTPHPFRRLLADIDQTLEAIAPPGTGRSAEADGGLSTAALLSAEDHCHQVDFIESPR